MQSLFVPLHIPFRGFYFNFEILIFIGEELIVSCFSDLPCVVILFYLRYLRLRPPISLKLIYSPSPNEQFFHCTGVRFSLSSFLAQIENQIFFICIERKEMWLLDSDYLLIFISIFFMGRSGLELMINFKLLIVQVLHRLSFCKIARPYFFCRSRQYCMWYWNIIEIYVNITLPIYLLSCLLITQSKTENEYKKGGR